MTQGVKWLKKGVTAIFRGFVITVLLLFILEACYRFQLWDFYKTEWSVLNKADDGQKAKRILVFGDSFGAQTIGFANQLQNELPEYAVYNASIPGTCAIQHAFIAKRRIREVNPDIVILQTYVGNDLLDVYPTINWSEYSLARNFYYRLSTWFRVLGYLNYKSGQLKHYLGKENLNISSPDVTEPFSTSKYSERTKMLIRGNADYINQSIALSSDGSRKAMSKLNDNCQSILKRIDNKVKVYILVLPHCIQTNKQYKHQFEQMGAIFTKYEPPYEYLNELKKLKVTGVINALPALKEAEENRIQCYYSNDPHMSENGHKVVTEVILKDLFTTSNFQLEE
ncbi:MAG: hypothetical protein KDC92_03455 [Bacteroidetes bacterium]|nr:hypothetical protein [Bacteroidota bacterium]